MSLYTCTTSTWIQWRKRASRREKSDRVTEWWHGINKTRNHRHAMFGTRKCIKSFTLLFGLILPTQIYASLTWISSCYRKTIIKILTYSWKEKSQSWKDFFLHKSKKQFKWFIVLVLNHQTSFLQNYWVTAFEELITSLLQSSYYIFRELCGYLATYTLLKLNCLG